MDSNVLIAALKEDEVDSERCSEILGRVPDAFVLSEPSIVYQEVCGVLARRVGINVANRAKEELDLIIHPSLLVDCDRNFCTSAYHLCSRYDIYAIDAMYLKVALDHSAVLVSLDRKDFIEKVNAEGPGIEAYHVSDFPR